MRWRLTACRIPLAALALGIGGRAALPAPFMQPAFGEGPALFQRVDALRPSNNPLKHCLTRKGEPSCHNAAKAKNAQAPQLPQYPGGSTGAAAATDNLPLPSKPPPNANRSNANRRLNLTTGEPHAGGPTPGLNFTGGMGVPTNRATLEGALSPYQQPNGNTAASQSGKLTNGLETQGMHFGFEYHY
jgi:hypothetical protein